MGYNSHMSTDVEAAIRGELLRYQQADGPTTISVGSQAWFDWLQQADRFVIETPGGRIRVRRERAGNKRGGWYWRAYRKAGGQLRRFYLGDDAELTPERLALSVSALFAPERHDAASGEPNNSEHDPFVRTKTVPPQQFGQLVPRHSLLALLREKLAAPVTLLIAPPGFGKTTLLLQLVAPPVDAPPSPQAGRGLWTAAHGPVWSWLTLDAGDSQPERLVCGLAAAL